MKICAIIPAFNEERTVAETIKKTLHYTKECVVINDGSSDKTAIIAKKSGATIIAHKKNLGTGRATQTGLLYAVKHCFDVVVLLDADGQHDPKYIPRLLGEFKSNADMVIGSRYFSRTPHGTSYLRKKGTAIISFLIHFKLKKKIYDPTSGFRVLNKNTLQFLAKHYPIIFPEPEATIKLIRHGFHIKEVSIKMKARRFGKSSISPLKALWLMVYITKRILFDTN